MPKFDETFDTKAIRRIEDAVREIERRSSAEVVVEIRARSGSYAHAGARFAALFTLATLAILVFMPWTVPAIMVVLDPIAAYAAGILLARRSSSLQRLFTTRRERLDAVGTHAAALFHRRGIANTTGETGVLVYVSLLERRMEVLADRGILRSVNAIDWNAALTALHIERRFDADAIIAALRTLTPSLHRDLPAADENADELTSAPEIELA